jgi:hypothetical protein
MAMKNLAHSPIVFNGRTVPISELPKDIREAEFTVGLQLMLDRGFFGDYPKGTNIFEVMRITPEITPREDLPEDHQQRWAAICEQLDVIHAMEERGEDVTELRRAYQKAIGDHDMLIKLGRR